VCQLPRTTVTAFSIDSLSTHAFRFIDAESDILAMDSKYVVRVARVPAEIAAALRLRYTVFNEEFGIQSRTNSRFEYDEFDFHSEHLIATERTTGTVIGTYRINSISDDKDVAQLYSHQEFILETLSSDILQNSVEIGRACIARDHRNSKALFLMWKGLARYLVKKRKRYFFGCCSIFTRRPDDGAAVYRQLLARDAVHSNLRVTPRRNAIDINAATASSNSEIPHLFEMYLRLGAKVCGPPMYDAEFGSVDFFVLFDLKQMNDRYRRMFFS
jgi:putative hemolysin